MPQRFEASARGNRIDPEAKAVDPFAATLQGTQMPILVTDPRLPDHPIVFANDAFLALTGYRRHEVIGRNCRFLQGPGTDRACAAAIRQAILEEQPQFRGDILNYRRDGTPFWNALFLSPVRDEAGEVVYFFASQTDVTARKQRELVAQQRAEELEAEVGRRTAELQRTVDELQDAVRARTDLLHEVDHRVKNNLQMIASLVKLQARRTSDEGAQQGLRAVAQRVEALSTVHRRLYQGSDVSRFDIAAFAHDLGTDLVAGSGRTDIALELDLEPVEIAKDKAAPLALLVNELITNAVRHAFRERGGRIVVRVRPLGPRVLIEVLDDGVGLPGQELGRGSFGRLVIDVLARQLQASVEWGMGEPGTRVSVDLPLVFSHQGAAGHDAP